LISCYPIGVILPEDQDGNDSKIVAVQQTKVSPEFSKINDVIDLPTFFRHKLEKQLHYRILISSVFISVKTTVVVLDPVISSCSV
jgi:inorganic pyrophosphatase